MRSSPRSSQRPPPAFSPALTSAFALAPVSTFVSAPSSRVLACARVRIRLSARFYVRLSALLLRPRLRSHPRSPQRPFLHLLQRPPPASSPALTSAFVSAP
eukprot:872957-Prorocentrum_minimum.AAC.1